MSHTLNLKDNVKNCFIDLTTMSPVYNPLGAQGQWMFHRFGKRDYPELELDTERVMNLLEDLPNLESVYFHSVFGDPLCYSHIYGILTYLSKRDIKVFVKTYGHNYTDRLTSYKIEYELSLAGMGFTANSVFLKTNWEHVRAFLSDFHCITVKFQTYQHNRHQIEEITKLCAHRSTVSVDAVPGMTYQDGTAHIIDERGEWLYDVTTNPEGTTSLLRSAVGYNLLKKYAKIEKGPNILSEKLSIPSFNGSDPILDTTLSTIYIGVTGHVFLTHEHMNIFSNALCSDWSEGVKNYSTHEYNIKKRDQYVEYVCDQLHFLHKNVNKIDLKLNSIETILSSFNIPAAGCHNMVA